MDRIEYEKRITSLRLPTDKHTPMSHGVFIRETEKAVLIELPNGVAGEREIWFPKSQLACKPDEVMGGTLYVLRSWLSCQRLWNAIA